MSRTRVISELLSYGRCFRWVALFFCLSLGIGISNANGSILVPATVDSGVTGQILWSLTSAEIESQTSMLPDLPTNPDPNKKIPDNGLPWFEMPAGGTSWGGNGSSANGGTTPQSMISNSVSAAIHDALVIWIDGVGSPLLETKPSFELLRPPRMI